MASYQIQQSTTAWPLVFLMVQATDHLTGATGLSPTVTLSKNGGAFAVPAGAVTEVGNGFYKVAGNATDSGTLGPLVLHATATGADVCDVLFEVVAVNPQSVAYGLSLAKTTNLTGLNDIAATAVVSGGAITTSGGAVSNVLTLTTYTGNTPQTGDSYAIVNSGTYGNAAIKGYVDDIGTAGAGLTAIPWNAAWDAEVQSEVDDALVAKGLDHLVFASVTGTDVADNSIIAKLVSKSATADWDSYVNTTDALEALRDRGDAAWLTATGFSTHTAADVWSVATRVLTAGTNIQLPSNGLANVTAWTVDVTGSLSGSVGSVTSLVTANVTQLSGDATAADNAEAFFDGTGYAGANNVIPLVTTTTNLTNAATAGDLTATMKTSVTTACTAATPIAASVSGAVGSVTGSIGSLSTQAKADVNAEVLDVLNVDTFTEPASVPAATASFRSMLHWVFTLLRNKRTQTTSTETLLADDGTTTIATSAKSDASSTLTRGEWS